MVNQEEIRRLKLAVYSPMQGEIPQCVCIAGVSGDEGCSTMAESLARELAETERETVLLIDGSINKPVLQKRFKSARRTGLIDVLTGQCRYQDAIQSTETPNLVLMTAGDERHEEHHKLDPLSLPEFISEIKNRYRFIVMDAGPVFPHAFVLMLSAVSDGVVLVVRPGYTRGVLARSAIQEIRRTQPNIIGVAFNRKRYWIPDWLYRWLRK